jgi:hypothetical protein
MSASWEAPDIGGIVKLAPGAEVALACPLARGEGRDRKAVVFRHVARD